MSITFSVPFARNRFRGLSSVETNAIYYLRSYHDKFHFEANLSVQLQITSHILAAEFDNKMQFFNALDV